MYVTLVEMNICLIATEVYMNRKIFNHYRIEGAYELTGQNNYYFKMEGERRNKLERLPHFDD